ncbi:MAG: carbon storage regulator [Planctomycetota bacterium]
MRYNIKITIEKISKSQIKISIESPKEVVIYREEVHEHNLTTKYKTLGISLGLIKVYGQ